MTSAAARAAAAVHSILPGDPKFPARGVIEALGGVNRAGGTPVLVGLVVSVDGVKYYGSGGLSWSGPFAAECDVPDPSVLIGRTVKVESLGGQLLVAYTTNWG